MQTYHELKKTVTLTFKRSRGEDGTEEIWTTFIIILHNKGELNELLGLHLKLLM